MTSGVRVSIVSLIVSAVLVVVATAVVPVRVRLGDKSFPCPTVVRDQPDDPLASALCDRVGAYRLRATFGIAALLAVLSLVPLALTRRNQLFVWAGATVTAGVVTITLLAAVGGRFQRVFVDL